MNPGERRGAGIGPELIQPVSGGQSDDSHSGGAGCLDPGRGVLDHETVGRIDREPCRGHEINIRTWLPVEHVLGTDENPWYRKTGPFETVSCNHTGARSTHGPAAYREFL
jgi:hypothetical protein